MKMPVTCEPENQAGELVVVIFSLADNHFAIPISDVREVIKLPAVVKMPESDECVEGMINIRGKVIPVIHLQKKLKLGNASVCSSSRVMIVELCSLLAGLIVDHVSEVARIQWADVQKPPQINGVTDSRQIKGIIHYGGKLAVLLSLERIFAPEETASCIKNFLNRNGGL